MPVLADCVSVLIRNATLETCYPGGVSGFERDCPNSTYCTDGLISRVGFMDIRDAIAYVDHLAGMGLPSPAASPDIAIFQPESGFTAPCSWLHVAVADLGEGNEVVMAWLRGTDSQHFVAPPGWTPGRSTFQITREELERDYELVGIQDGVEARRHRVTGQMIYQGHPTIPKRKRWWEFWR